jgi:putative ABC transport system permease protein
LRPLPYPDSSRLVFVWQRFPGMPAPFSDHTTVAPQNYRKWRRQNTVFQEMAAFRTTQLQETGGSGGKVLTTFLSADLFHLFGIQPRLGRLFHPDEERTDRARVAVLSGAYFNRRFIGDPKALGQPVTLDDTPYKVIGVLPASFYLPPNVAN